MERHPDVLSGAAIAVKLKREEEFYYSHHRRELFFSANTSRAKEIESAGRSHADTSLNSALSADLILAAVQASLRRAARQLVLRVAGRDLPRRYVECQVVVHFKTHHRARKNFRRSRMSCTQC